jgi:AhpD family alkylhydroperoxidase
MLNAESDVEPETREIFRSVEAMGLDRFMNQFAALAHHPALAKALHQVMRAYYFDSVVAKKHLELAILMVSRLNRCNYCVVHHTPTAITEGIVRAQLDAIDNGTWRESELFDPAEKAVLCYAEQMNIRKGRVDDSLFEELEKHFDRTQIVELTVRIGMCEFFNRFNEALQLDIEPVAEKLYADVTDS